MANARGRGRFPRSRGRAGLSLQNRRNKQGPTHRIDEPAQELHQTRSSPAQESSDDDNAPNALEDSDPEDDVTKPYTALLRALRFQDIYCVSRQKRRKLKHAPSPGDINGTSNEQKATISTTLDERLSRGSSLSKDETVVGLDVPHEQEGPGSPNRENASVNHAPEEEPEETASDPFETHFANPDSSQLSKQIAAVKGNQWDVHKLDLEPPYKVSVMRPSSGSGVEVPLHTGISSLGSLKLKPKIAERAAKHWPTLNHLKGNIASYLFNYVDLLFCARTLGNADSLRRLACLHALNHVLKTRDRVVKNNARKAKDKTEDLELRDQGFTRPKVLFLLPTRQSCVKVLDAIVAFYKPEQQENRARFQESYSGDVHDMPSHKPPDFQDLFGGNDDDLFRIGLKFTRKSIKLFARFYNSDIILASPLGLRMAMGADAMKKDFDFLSSIEVVIIDQADALLMQKWENVEYVLDHLNQQPKEAHGCDFSRVREWYLDGNAPYLRQTIVFSAFNQPDLNVVFQRHMKNVAGRAKLTQTHNGALLELGLQLKQTFSRFVSPQPALDPDARFTYFTTAVLPVLVSSLKRSGSTAAAVAGRPPQGILIFIPSYFDFVRVRNYFSTSSLTQNVSFGSISEYTVVRDVARARSHFFTGRQSILLYTERAHHFWRFNLRGVTTVVMYGLPENPLFYREIVSGFLAASVREGRLEPAQASVRSLFSKWDALQLERVVGSGRVASLLHEKAGDTFDFV